MADMEGRKVRKMILNPVNRKILKNESHRQMGRVFCVCVRKHRRGT
jgi:hypothetical protein